MIGEGSHNLIFDQLRCESVVREGLECGERG